MRSTVRYVHDLLKIVQENCTLALRLQDEGSPSGEPLERAQESVELLRQVADETLGNADLPDNLKRVITNAYDAACDFIETVE